MTENTSTSVIRKDISAELQAVDWRTITIIANSVTTDGVSSEDANTIVGIIYPQSDHEVEPRDIVINNNTSSNTAVIPAISSITVDEDEDKDSGMCQDRVFPLMTEESKR
jgi:hypothetical protein